MSDIHLSLTTKELEVAISGLLFSSSINIISDTDSSYQESLFELAKKLKEAKPDIKLNSIRFVQEENYEDEVSSKVIESFKNNIEVTSFDCV